MPRKKPTVRPIEGTETKVCEHDGFSHSLNLDCPAGPEDFGGSDEGSHLMAQAAHPERIVEEDDGAIDAETATMFGLDIPVHYPEASIGEPSTAEVEAKSAAQFAERLERMVNTAERREFIDRTAIAIFANGWPAKNVYGKAAQLWELRRAEIERGRL